jgi:predicted TIM-barrel fold metal-dependent hydrolase
MKQVDCLCERYELAYANGAAYLPVCGDMPCRWVALKPDTRRKNAMSTVETTRAYEKLKVIDTDSHLTEPHDLWIKRAPANMRERVPQVRMVDGQRCWMIDGNKSIGTGARPVSSIAKDGSKARGLSHWNFQIEDVHKGCYDATARVALMEELGIWAQVLYPNLLGFGGHKSAQVDPALRLLCVQIFNDAMAEFQEESRQRLFPMALLPWWDVDLAVKEGARAAAMGLRGININSDPQVHKDEQGKFLPDLGDPYWDPLWAMCCDRQLPVNFHIGASEATLDWYSDQGWPSLTRAELEGASVCMLFYGNGRVMANIIYSGLLDRYPKLKFVSVESGVGWIPFFLESLDYQYKEMVQDDRLERAPSEYFRRNFYGSYWFERDCLVDAIKAIGADNLMFETDFPHPTCLYPLDPQTTYNLPGLTAEDRRKVLSTNAASLYRIPVN